MKTIRIGYSILLMLFVIVPFNLLAQKEVPITSSSKEALDLFLKGREMLENFKSDEATTLFDRAIQKDPNFALAYLYRSTSGGGFNVYQQNLEKAVSLADKVSEGEKYQILLIKASSDGDGKKQKEYYDLLIKKFPEDKRIHLDMGNYYYGFNDFRNALPHFKKSAELDQNFAPAYNMIGYCQSSLNNYPEAEKAFKSYIKLSSESPNGYDSYAELLLKMGKYDESIAQYKKALEYDPAFSFSLRGLGNNYIFKGDYSAARKHYQDFYDKSQAFGDKLSALYWIACSYVHEGKIADAIKTFDDYRAIAEKENQATTSIWSYANQGFINIELGKPNDGIKYFEKAFDLIEKSKLPEATRENFNTYSMLWRMYAYSATGKLDLAENEANKCKQKVESRKNPGEEMFLNSMFGYMEFKKADYPKAIQYFSKADTEDPLNWYYNSIAFEKAGEKEKATALLKKITMSNINSLNLALVRNRAMTGLKEK